MRTRFNPAMNTTKLVSLGAALLLPVLPSCNTVRSDPLNANLASLHDSITYALPKGMLKVVIEKEKNKDRTIELTREMIADPKHYYTLSLLHSPLATDNYDILVEEGAPLLDKIINRHKDETGEVLKKVVELAVGGVRLASGLPAADAASEAYRFEYLVSFEEGIAGKTLVTPKGSFHLQLEHVGGADYSHLERAAPAHKHVIYYKVGLPYIATIKEAGQSVLSEMVYLPDESPVQAFNLKRGAFVQVGYDIDFVDGIPKQIKSSRPSEILAIVTAPVEALELISSALPVQIKIDQSKQDKALYDAQKDALQAHSNLIDAQIANLQKLQEQAGTKKVGPNNGDDL